MDTFICSTCKTSQPVNPWHKYVCKKCASKYSGEAQRRYRGQIKTCPICYERKPAWIFTTCQDCYNGAMSKYQKSKYAQLWQWYFELKSHPCVDCETQFHPSAMEWDHREDKEACVSTLLFQGATKERVLREIEKCDLVCANCHRVRTWIRRRSS